VSCRYDNKRHYPTRKAARLGAEDIRTIVTNAGGQYDTLYPYPCPDEDHWHLSHYPQGYRDCPRCGERKPAWNGGKIWVMSAHAGPDGDKCFGEGQAAITQEVRCTG
jgi:hypothetical protein